MMRSASAAARRLPAGVRAQALARRGLTQGARMKESPPAAPPAPPKTPAPAWRTPKVIGGPVAVVALYSYREDIKAMLGFGDAAKLVDDTGLTTSQLKDEVQALGTKIQLETQRANLREASKAASRAAAAAKEAEAASAPAPAVAAAAPAPAAAAESEAATPSRGSLVAQSPGKGVDFAAVRAAIEDILDEPDYDDGSVAPLFVRLAWHNAGTFDKNSGLGGSEGACMRFQNEGGWGANAGLGEARARLEPIKAKFPGVTYSDLWSLAGTVALEAMGGPEIKWRPGRKDFAAGADSLPDGLLPDAALGADHLRAIFGRMGFNDQEIVALSGAHAVGRCHTDRSGFWGPWTRAPTTLSNEYFKLLLSETWSRKKTHEGKAWTGPAQYENGESGADLMMLETDLALVADDKMKPFVEAYAADEELFFKDFAAAWIKLNELGVRRFHGTRRYYLFGPRE